jgi:hypothetical protein
MNREAFFAHLRRRDSGVFGTSLTQPQVQGIEAILDVADGLPLHHVANILAQVYRETGRHMAPIKETVMSHHKDKNPSDAEVIRRLDRAFAAGQLTWVRTPYWREGWFGRGQIQITHRVNYERLGKRIGVDLVSDPSRTLDLTTSAMIAVIGMTEGMFRKHRLSDYNFPADLDAPVARNPRRIVNGADGSDREVAAAHRAFAAALESGGWRQETPRPAPAQPDPAEQPRGLLATILALLARIFGGGK